MEILLISHDIKVFVKIVMLFAVNGGGKITRGVQRSAVRLKYKTRRHTVFFKVDNHCPLAFGKQVFRLELVDYGLHFVVVKTFARIGIEFYAQSVVNSLDFLKRDVFELIEYFQGAAVAVLDFFEPRPAFRLQTFVFFRLGVKADVKV